MSLNCAGLPICTFNQKRAFGVSGADGGISLQPVFRISILAASPSVERPEKLPAMLRRFICGMD
jgi:hypothetical protein